MGQHLDKAAKGAYDAIVYIEGSEVVAEDANGRKIASGVAGTNDKTVIDSAVAYISSGGTLVLRGSFTPASQILVEKDINIIGQNCTINIPVGYTGNDILMFRGDTIRSTTLTFDVSAGASSVPITDASGVVPGDLVLVYDDSIYNTVDYPTVKRGELHRIRSVSGNTITIEDDLLYSYDFDSLNATAVLISPIKISISSVSVVGLAQTITDYRGIYLSGCVDSVISNCVFSDISVRANCAYRSYNVAYRDCVISGCNYVGYGYGIAVLNACSHVSIDCDICNCIHSITVGCDSTPGQSRDVCVTGGSYNFIDAHAYAESLFVSNSVIRYGDIVSGAKHTVISACKIYDGEISCRGNWDNRTFVIRECSLFGEGVNGGIVFNNPSYPMFYLLVVENNTFYNTAYGISVLTGAIDYVKICNNVVHQTASHSSGISISNAIRGVVSNNIIQAAERAGIYLNTVSNIDVSENSVNDVGHVTSNLWSGIYMLSSSNCRVNSNKIRNVSISTMKYSIFADSGCTGNQYIDNDIVSGVSGVISIAGTGHTIRHNFGYLTDNSGSSTGTGSEQTIAHGLAAIPTGCKAWIKYLVGTRYITEMVPFDATNIYPTVETGVAYEWRIE